MSETYSFFWGVKPSNGRDDGLSEVVVKNDEIRYTGVIEPKGINKALEAIREIAEKAKKEWEESLIKNPEMDPIDRKKTIIKFFIQSVGGLVYEAFRFMDIVDMFVNCSPIEIHTYIVGYAFSAGTLIASIGSKRYATKRSHVMIHELFGGMEGNYTQLKSRFQNLDRLHDGIIHAYLTINRLKSREEIEKLLKEETWFTAQEYYEQGFLDDVV